MRLKRKFFNRNTLIVAQELLGKYIVRKINGKIMKFRIVETEAYCGFEDQASHASRGITPRTKLMFGPPGYAYIYMIYGMYFCMNVVTERENYPAAVLVRGIETVRGPGRVCRELRIDKKLNGIDLITSKELWMEEGKLMPGVKIKTGKRIGVDYAGKWKEKRWRFYI